MAIGARAAPPLKPKPGSMDFGSSLVHRDRLMD